MNGDIKSGWRTSEFYVSLLAIILGGCYAVELIPSEGPWAKLAGLAVVVLTAFGYTVSRGKAKSLLPLLLVAVVLLPSCGMLTGLQTGAQGQTPESVANTISDNGNPIVAYFNFFGNTKLMLVKGADGDVKVEATTDGGSEIGSASFAAPYVTYGENMITGNPSTGGGSTAGSQPGSGGGIDLPINVTPGSGTTIETP